jgi:hypothetical protein
MHRPFMNWGKEIITLEAVPTQVGDGWRILIEVGKPRDPHVRARGQP